MSNPLEELDNLEDEDQEKPQTTQPTEATQPKVSGTANSTETSFTNDGADSGTIKFEDLKKKHYKFTIPNNANLGQLNLLFGAMMTFHVDEDHEALRLVKKWGWNYEEEPDVEFNLTSA